MGHEAGWATAHAVSLGVSVLCGAGGNIRACPLARSGVGSSQGCVAPMSKIWCLALVLCMFALAYF